MTKLQAILDRVIVKPRGIKEQVTSFGFIHTKKDQPLVYGEVVSVGELVGRSPEGKPTGLQIEEGDVVLYNSRSVDELDDGNVIMSVLSIFGVEK